MSNRTADELLKWGLRNAPAHSDGTSSVAHVAADVAAGRRPDLADPGLYDAIMGKSEAQMMQEELAVAVDAARSVEDRCTALDNFEMLIEQVDNANNMAPMHMWPPVLSLLAPEHAPEILVGAAWVVGTAIQNNDKAQATVLEHGALPRLLALLDAPSVEVRSKGLYALSALLKHYPAAVAQFDELHGWSKLRAELERDSLALRRKVVFLLAQLLRQTHDVPPPPAPAPTTASVHLPAPRDERPATMRGDVPHPPVAQILVDQNVLGTVLASLLDSAAPAAVCDGAPVREDDDYYEKALQMVSALLRAEPQPHGVPAAALQALARDVASSAARLADADVDLEPLRAYA